jgi:predicted TIM-barrel fold metal-dependent hydrolase
MIDLPMTRRSLLATLPALTISGKGGAAPAPFDKIDAHLHIHRLAPTLFEAFEKERWRGLSICLSEATGNDPTDLDEQMVGTAEVHRATGGRLAWASSFDARGFEGRDFAERVIGSLQRTFGEGAIGVKIWKTIGMEIRAKSGEYLLPDHAVFTPIFDAVQKADRTLIAHLGEPDGAWMPLNAANPELSYYSAHPEWSMLNHPGAPSKDAILTARDRILARHPKLRLVGCHLGSDEGHLERLAKRLDTYPNFAVDTAGRVRYFILGDHEAARQFLLKYQDRVLYATDFTLRPGNDAETAEKLRQQHDLDWKFFSTTETIQFRGKSYQGLGLPASVARKVFHDNARRWLPGIAPA